MTTPTTQAGERTYSADQVAHALNQAVDAIVARLGDDIPESGLIDGLNLLVNTSIAFLEKPYISLQTAIRGAYSEEPETVLDWVREAC